MTPFRRQRCLCYVLLWLSGSYPGDARAQDFSIPSGWQRTSNDLSRGERETIASSAAQTLLGHINATSGTPSGIDAVVAAQSVSVLAFQDIYSGNDSYRQNVINALDIYAAQTVAYGRPYGASNKNTLYWGLAASYAYKAYANASSLDLAASSWNFVHADLVTPAMAQSGSLPRAASLHSSCATDLAGGLFTQHANQSDSTLSAEANGLFMSLSAYLYNATHNETYLDAAELSAVFIQTHLYTDGAVVGAFDALNCTSEGTPLSRPWFTGLYVEGLAVLASTTGNDTWHQALENSVPSAVTHNTWYRADGVLQVEPNPSDLTDSSNMLKCVLLRGVLTAWALNLGTPMASLIETFITIQFNAVTTLARLPGASQYSSSWVGPATSSFDTLGTIAAMDVLTAGFATTSNDTQTADSEPQPSRRVNIAAIAGGVVGGVVGSLVLGASLWFSCRRRSRRASVVPAVNPVPEDSSPTLIEPFVARPTIPPWRHHSKEKTYVGDSSSSLAVLPPTRAESDSRSQSRAESPATPDLATVARQVDRIAQFLDTWSPSNHIQPTTDLLPPPTAPPQYTRTTTSRS
ncbi:unnamed protein product [Peniophora sp. CBMAI 1063]|nr:unnamed protein product [Peniophora sp. CBMAI 1063]